jgi:hypothetical protein
MRRALAWLFWAVVGILAGFGLGGLIRCLAVCQ